MYPINGGNERIWRFDVYGKTFTVHQTPHDGTNSYLILNQGTLDYVITYTIPGIQALVFVNFQIFPATQQIILFVNVGVTLTPIFLNIADLVDSDKVPPPNILDPYKDTMQFYSEAGSPELCFTFFFQTITLQEGVVIF